MVTLARAHVIRRPAWARGRPCRVAGRSLRPSLRLRRRFHGLSLTRRSLRSAIVAPLVSYAVDHDTGDPEPDADWQQGHAARALPAACMRAVLLAIKAPHDSEGTMRRWTPL
jgi:hypothetical protein